MSDVLSQYDPYLLRLARMLDPGDWWERGPVGYVSSMMDARSFEERAAHVVKIADRLITWVAETINSDDPLAPVLEDAIQKQIDNIVGPLQEKVTQQEQELAELRAFASLHQSEDNAGDDFIEFTDDIEIDSERALDNPLIGDLVRAAPLAPRRDIALVDIGDVKVTPPADETTLVASQDYARPYEDLVSPSAAGALNLLAMALRRAQYTAEPLGFDVTASVTMYQGNDKDDVLATMDVATEGRYLSSHRVWVNPEKAPEKHAQVYGMVTSAAQDVGQELLKLSK